MVLMITRTTIGQGYIYMMILVTVTIIFQLQLQLQFQLQLQAGEQGVEKLVAKLSEITTRIESKAV